MLPVEDKTDWSASDHQGPIREDELPHPANEELAGAARVCFESDGLN